MSCSLSLAHKDLYLNAIDYNSYLFLTNKFAVFVFFWDILVNIICVGFSLKEEKHKVLKSTIKKFLKHLMVMILGVTHNKWVILYSRT